ncbi:cilia- and flagella-associated protein 61-like isoform X1 [Aricia agestis]|uniref:cilia- and flagella-associated protein 61-like isoform X1 n=1 Tax=Aricia agestis TaxID=91739 RepID=UPI001C20AB53|nr:cilia- and flagella-associated protein 61-like isoform X1 [Aricia agestis]
MSIYFDFDVSSLGGRFRRAVDGDRANIEAIIDRTCTVPLFEDVDIGSLIELSTLSICMIDEKHSVTGFMAVSDHPNVPGLDPADWEIWMRNMFQKFYLARNTVFIHFMHCVDSLTHVFLDEAFKSIFRNDVYLQKIVMVVPPKCPDTCITRYLPKSSQAVSKFLLKRMNSNEIYLHVASRDDYCPPLKIRRAVEEDNDDVVKILGAECPRLQELYGDYYISELISRHPEMKRKIIVAGHQSEVVGVMCLSSEVNYETLQDTYELATYNGLQKATPHDKEIMKRENEVLKVFGDPIMCGRLSPFSTLEKELATEKRTQTGVYDGKQNSTQKTDRLKTKVIFQHDTDEVEIRHHSMDKVCDNNDNINIIPSPSFVDVIGDDSFDYDIVNIKENLLSVPDALMHEMNFQELRNKKISSDERDGGKHGKKPLTHGPSELKRLKTQRKHYSGGPDAFIIELFALREDIDAIHAFELLQGAFEIMPDLDYCLISLPCETKTFQLLRHFCFVPTKPDVNSKYALYVAHRSSVFSKLRVRKAEIIDIPQIASFLQSIDCRDIVWTVENTILKNNDLKCYVFMSALNLVGIGLLEPADELNLVETTFNMSPYHFRKYHQADPIGSYAIIKSVFVYPVFEPHFRFFARDMMRLSGSTTLMFLTAYRNKWSLNKANTLVGSMVPILPRISEMPSSPALSNWMDMSPTIMPFSAWMLSKKLTSIPQVNVNTRIVIVGASRTAIAFLNALLFSDTSTYLLFTNITLVSTQGMPYCRRHDIRAETMFNKYKTNSDKYMKSVPYTYYVNVVKGRMVKIDKREKYIQLANGSRCDYDQLFLLFGRQYQHPHHLDDIINTEKNCTDDGRYKRMDVPEFEAPIEPYNLPRNLFLINTLLDANKAVSFVKSFDLKCDDKIIVYGSSLNPYCCIATLLELNVPGENIIFVEPFPDENPRKTRVPVFCNLYVDKTVRESMEKLKIQVYRSYYFKSWTVDVDNFVSDVSFTSATKIITLPCVAFFYYGRKAVNKEAFVALNKSGIVYDGGIQIDHQFRTNDSSIYAAGSVTRYHRSYFADHKRLKYFDAFEIGTKLGEQIRNDLDPLMPIKQRNRKENETFYQPPHLKSPYVLHCSLPGLRYLEVRSPGKKMPHHYVQLLDYNGFVLETFKGGYFKLHLTKDFRVDAITCLTSENRSLIDFKHIYGLPSSVLNNVFLRFMTKRIDNLYEFFESSWASFLYHEQSQDLFASVKEILPKASFYYLARVSCTVILCKMFCSNCSRDKLVRHRTLLQHCAQDWKAPSISKLSQTM